jgi:NitT/TauT family transport system substrate-binding protein
MSLHTLFTRTAVIALAAGISVTSMAARADAALTKVRYAETIHSLMFVPSYVALAKGYFRDAGLDVSMTTPQGTDKTMAALLSHSTDIVLVGPEAVIYVWNSESPEKAKMFAGNTATDGFFLMSRKKIVGKFDWNALKGQEIMSWRPGSTPDVFLAAALRKHGLDPATDVKLVSNISPVARMGAWLSGRTDYGIFTEPNASTLEREGKAFFAASDGHEVGQVDYTVYVATDSYIKKHPKVIQAWTDAIARGERYVQSASPTEIAKTVSKFFPGLDLALIESAVTRNRKYGIWKTTPLIKPEAIRQFEDLLVQSGLLAANKRVPYKDVVDPTFAKNIK